MMKKKPFYRKLYVVVLLCCLYSFRGQGQINLVKNPSFEDVSACATGYDQIAIADYWNSLDTNLIHLATNEGIPELINECHIGGPWPYYLTCAPFNLWFFSYPHSGKNMAQEYILLRNLNDSNEQRDYLQGKLKSKLISGKNYCVTFYTKQEHGSSYSSKAASIYFDDGTIDTTSWPARAQSQFTPQVTSNNFITDTARWVKIEGSFTANGTELFFTIGNFNDNAHTDTSYHLNDTGTWFWHILNLFDDISVIESNTTANAGNDTTIHKGDSILIGEIAVPYTWYKRTTAGLSLIDSVSGGIWVKPDSTTTYVVKLTLCGVVTWDSIKVTVVPVGINNINANGNVMLYPNPISNELNIANAPSGTSIRVYDIVGRLVYSGIFNAKQESIYTGSWECGAYFLELLLPDGSREVRKVVK